MCITGGSAKAYDCEVDGIYYCLNNIEKTAEVTYKEYGQSNYFGNVVIPETVTYNNQTYSVISIGYSAFYNCTGLTSITIPNTVTNIGSRAFWGCSGLTSITIPNSVTSIGEWAFWSCESLTNIAIPNSVTSIGNSAFENCSSLTSITIPNGVTEIGQGMFSGCRSLTSITIPNGVTSIGNGAFENCSSLASITIPNSVTSIGSRAFSFCSTLTSINIPNGVTSIGSNTFDMCCGLTSITIPNSVTTIGYRAFSDCYSLTSITIPNSVTSIDMYAFSGCYGLTSITLPNSVTSIGIKAFCGCTGLTSVISLIESPFQLDESVFSYIYTSSVYYLIYEEATLYVPKGKKEVYSKTDGWKLFQNIIELEPEKPTVFVAENTDGVPMTFKVTDEDCKICQIGDGTSAAINSNTERIVLPKSANEYTVTAIADNAFANCVGLESVYIPNSIQSIGENAFNGCTRLSSVDSYIEEPFAIPESVFANIANDASLDAIFGTKEKYQALTGWNVFNRIYAETAIVNGLRYSVDVPEENGAPYTAWVKSSKWKDYSGDVVIPEVFTIGDESFSVVGIDDGAFAESQITSVTIPSTVSSIDDHAFYNCSALRSVTSYIMEPKNESDAFINIPVGAILYVPQGTKDVYSQKGGWKLFQRIEEIDPMGIVTISSDSVTPKDYYSAGGERLNSQRKGLNIIRMSDGTVRKMMLR